MKIGNKWHSLNNNEILFHSSKLKLIENYNLQINTRDVYVFIFFNLSFHEDSE